MEQLVDSYGRRIKSMRISITDKCNFRCTYCMPAEGLPWLKKAEILSYEEIMRIARVAVEIGIEQIRLTGGEPLVRRDLPELVRQLHQLEGLHSFEPDHQWHPAQTASGGSGGGRPDAHKCQPGFADAREICPGGAP
jgi:tRNA A37 methylthiotransferase MiaB